MLQFRPQSPVNDTRGQPLEQVLTSSKLQKELLLKKKLCINPSIAPEWNIYSHSQVTKTSVYIETALSHKHAGCSTSNEQTGNKYFCKFMSCLQPFLNNFFKFKQTDLVLCQRCWVRLALTALFPHGRGDRQVNWKQKMPLPVSCSGK